MNSDLIQQLQTLIAQPKSTQTITFEPVTEWTESGTDPLLAEQGRELIAQGVCGCVLVAGGQGTRLGFHGPKGAFPVTPITGKSLFQRVSERVLAAGQQVGRLLPLAIMTSPENDQQTRDYFAKHHLFGLQKGQLEFFVQGSLPLLAMTNGEPLRTPNGDLLTGADGNGSVFCHFTRSGIAQRWKERGIALVSFIQVDNALADPYDAELLAFHERSHAEVTIKATWRDDPLEKVGVIVRTADTVKVVEYSEIDQQERERRDTTGNLQHRLANLSLFCFSLDFMQRAAALELPLHIARKTVTTQQGTVEAYKFEHFVFDALEFSRNTAIFVSARQSCFAALKNREGADSLATVQSDLLAYDRNIYKQLTGHPADSTRPLELSAAYYYPTSELKEALRKCALPTAGYIDSAVPAEKHSKSSKMER